MRGFVRAVAAAAVVASGVTAARAGGVPRADCFPVEGLPADARARADRSAADGFALVATAAPASGQVGWWRIDPVTGGTIGVTGDGYHSATTERQQIENKVNGMLDLPFRITIEEMRQYSQAEFAAMIANGKGLSGLHLLRVFQQASRLHELILLL